MDGRRGVHLRRWALAGFVVVLLAGLGLLLASSGLNPGGGYGP